MTTPAQIQAAAVLRDIVKGCAGASGRVERQPSEPGRRATTYEIRAQGFHVCFVELAVDGRLIRTVTRGTT